MKNLRLAIFVCIYILCQNLSAAFAADKFGTVSGTVIDYVSRKPLYGVNVYFPDLNIGAVTQEDGSFSIRVPGQVDALLEISYIGYETKRIPVTMNDGETREFTVYLNPGALRMDEIKVVGDRVRQTVFESSNFASVQSAEDFVKVDRKTTADLLIDEPGILIQKTTHAHGAPVIRGLIGRYILLLYNGIRLNRPTFRLGGNQYLNTISAESLHRIEVYRGPTSVLYGSDAIGGTVNMVSDHYESEGPDFTIKPIIQTGFSSADNGKYFSTYFKGSKDLLSFTGSLAYKDIGNLKPGGDLGAQDPTGWEEFDGSLNLFFEPSQRNHFEVNYLNITQDDVPRYDKYVTGEFSDWTYDPQKRQLLAASYTYNPPLSWLHRVKINLSMQREKEGRTQQKTGSADIRFDNDKISTHGAFIQFSSIAQNKHWLNWGAEFYRDRVSSTRTLYRNETESTGRGSVPDNSVYDSFGLYFQDNFIVRPRLDIGAGLRYSWFRYESPLEEPWGNFEDTFSDLTGSVSISYKPVVSVNVVGSYSRGFRAPNFNETVVLQYSNYGVDAPSPGLLSENSNNFEIGLKIEDERTKGGFFLYYNRMADLIDRRAGSYEGKTWFDENGNGLQDPEEPLVFQKFNVGKAEIYGTELYLSRRFDPFMFSGQLFYTHGRNMTVDEPMSRIPPLTARFGMQWFPNDKWWFELFSRMAVKQDRLSERDILDSRIPEGGTPGYFTLNFRSSYRFDHSRLVVRFDNLFDELYKTHGSGIYSPGRSVSLMLEVIPFHDPE